jgi:hypothetical protein
MRVIVVETALVLVEALVAAMGVKVVVFIVLVEAMVLMVMA